MKVDKRSAMVKCPTCNHAVCDMVGLGTVDTPAKEVRLDFRCNNGTCPAARFTHVFQIFPMRTIMDTEILPT